MIHFLRMLLTFSYYLGALCINFDKPSNEFKFYKFYTSLVLLIINCITNYYFYIYKYSKKVFIINMAAFVFLNMNLLTTTFIIFLNKKYEKQTVQVLNKVIKLQKNNQNHRVVKYLLLCITIIEILYTLITSLNAVFKKTNEKVISTSAGPILTLIVYMYINFIKMVTESRYQLMFLMISKCYENLNKITLKKFSKQSLLIMKQHQELFSITKKAHKIFSLIILFGVGTYFVCIVVRTLSIYYSFNQGKLFLNEFEIVSLFVFIIKLHNVNYLHY